MKFCICLAIGLAFSALPAAAEVLDQKKVHSDYNEGNFERVLTSLEGYMARNKTYSLEDSIFIAKHLAVVYSANPQTREKGKYYMYRLLAMLPSAKLIDMYVSDEIDRIFDKVREEYLSRQKAFGVDTTQVSIPSQSPAKEGREPLVASRAQPAKEAKPAANPPRQGHQAGVKPAYLIAGGTALVAAGLAAYFIFSDEPEKTEKYYVVP